MYCSKCGTENPDDGDFCNNCGNAVNNLKTKMDKTSEENVNQGNKITLSIVISWLFGLLFLIIGLAFFSEKDFISATPIILVSLLLIPPVTKWLKDKLNFELSRVERITFVIILLIAFVMLVPDTNSDINTIPNTNSQTLESSISIQTSNPTTAPTSIQTPITTPTPTSTPIPTSTPAPTTVKKDLSKIALTLDDMPSGSTKHGDDVTDSSSIERTFILRSYSDIILLVCKVNSYSTIQKAENEYNQKIDDYSIKTESDIGDEGIELCTPSSGCTVVFRKANIIVEVDWLENYYISYGNSAMKYAKIVESRI